MSLRKGRARGCTNSRVALLEEAGHFIGKEAQA